MSSLAENKKVGWFCLSTQPKHEHIAAAHLRKLPDVEVFLPRIRFKRPTRKKSVWVTEALFPGYLFARFDFETSLRRVQSSAGTRRIVHFGKSFPMIPETVIAELQGILGTTELHTISEHLSPGDAVQISEGTLRGLSAVVSRILPGRERVGVLMELLGRQTMVDLATASLIKEGRERPALFGPPGPS